MKKTNMAYILFLFFLSSALALLVTLFLLKPWTPAFKGNMQGIVILFIIFEMFACVLAFTFVRNIIFSNNVKKLEQTFDDHNFKVNFTFSSNNCNFYIDNTHHQIGTITRSNPFVLQIADASAVEKAWVDNGSGMSLMGTRLVRFCFLINGKSWKIPTFSSNTTFSLSNQKVQEAIAKAEHQVGLILSAKHAS